MTSQAQGPAGACSQEDRWWAFSSSAAPPTHHCALSSAPSSFQFASGCSPGRPGRTAQVDVCGSPLLAPAAVKQQQLAKLGGHLAALAAHGAAH